MSISPAVFYIASLVVFAAFVVVHARRHAKEGQPLMRSTLAWSTPFVLGLAFLAFWDLQGLVDVADTPQAAPLTALAICIAGIVTVLREDVWTLCDKFPRAVRIALLVALALLTVCLSVLVIEVPFNGFILDGGPSHFWLETLLVGLLLVALFFLGQRHAVACCAGLALAFVTGIGQYFLKIFKNAAILPADLSALGTAAAVSSEYVFVLNGRALQGITLAFSVVSCLALVKPPMRRITDKNSIETKNGASNVPRRSKGMLVGVNLATSAVAFALLGALIIVPSYTNDFGLKVEYWYTMDYYQLQGFYPSFIAVLQDMPIKRPEGYTNERAQQMEQAHAKSYREAINADEAHTKAATQFEQTKPAVVFVMNESFSDASKFDKMHAGYEGPQFFKNEFNDGLMKGTLNVSVHGGGTCNSEFEFLTGNAIAFVGAGKYPYSIYNFAQVDAIAAQFKSMGYDTCAMHPNYETNWNRDEIYPQMGFDTFLSIDDFGGMPDCEVDKVTPNEPHCEVFHSGVSDKETYDRTLAILRDTTTPQFIFDVTMANHGSYDQNNIPAEYQLNYSPADYDGDVSDAELNEYLSCIQRADDDLRYFVGELRKLKRPVVLVFFGDHQPTLTMSYNDAWYSGEDEGVHARRAFSTSYAIWANYDVAGHPATGATQEMSVDMLAARALDLIGAPVTDYQAAQLDIFTRIRSLSTVGYLGDDGTWYQPGTSTAYDDLYNDLWNIEYWHFATKV